MQSWTAWSTHIQTCHDLTETITIILFQQLNDKVNTISKLHIYLMYTTLPGRQT